MKMTYFSKMGCGRGAPRFWVEGERLAQLGFIPGQALAVTRTGFGLEISPARHVTETHTVSRRRAAGGYRPIIDINSRMLLAHLEDYRELKIGGSYNRLAVSPSIQAASIFKHSLTRSTYRVLDVCCGGGSLSDAFSDDPRFQIVAGVEYESTYADEFSRKHQEAEIIVGNFRHIHPVEFPEFDVLLAGIPCVEHSALGRAKKSLSGKPELGEAGDLFIPILSLIAARLPVACVLENVPSFGPSLAGQTAVTYLERLGYTVATTIIDPVNDYAEPSTRRRWVCVATLKPGFSIPNPQTPFTGSIAQFIDAPDAERDRADATRIARTFASLQRHADRHNARGDSRHRLGKALIVLNGTEKTCPTFCKSYYKINNSGAYLATPYGPRQFRPHEVCAINGQKFTSTHPASIYQMAGQGVLTRLFKHYVAIPLADHLS